MYCNLKVRPRAKVTIDSLYEVEYWESIGSKLNNLDLCLCHSVGHISALAEFLVYYADVVCAEAIFSVQLSHLWTVKMCAEMTQLRTLLLLQCRECVYFHAVGSVRARNPIVSTEVVGSISRVKRHERDAKESSSSSLSSSSVPCNYYSAICTLDG